MKTQSGNALFLILIAIFLLGALTALVARTGGNTEETGDTERTRLKISELLRYGNGIIAGVQNLLARGCSENQLSFWYDENADGLENVSDSYYNANSPTDRSCHVFAPQGAGLIKKVNLDFFPDGTWPVNYNDFTGRNVFPEMGTSAPELNWIVELPSNINRADFCTQMNRMMNLANPTPPLATVSGTVKFVGSFSGAPTIVTATEFSGKKSYCYNYTLDTTRYFFYMILMVR